MSDPASTLAPGSSAARLQGCECPVIDNGRGLGILGGTIKHPESGRTVYVMSADCPLHGAAVGYEWGEVDSPRLTPFEP